MLQRLKTLWKLADPTVAQEPQAQGDGKAVVMSDFTEDELAQYQHEEQQGWKYFYNRIRRWTNSKNSNSE